MIVLGNPDFAAAMRLVGVEDSFVVRSREDVDKVIGKIGKDEFILVNPSVLELYPDLNEFRNLVSIPDDPDELKTTQDLNDIIKNAVGIELNI
ncbi:hypothetical protein CMO89_00360 [Candidatus Woesearchaeota archaeon]|nr:hypothetical protein [Candidatus Woesearchaeota archaeon]|tara:strand:- start:5182 stop:5460 length:279 start_codon:yes stop_codon:yes gene_type:complete